MTFTKVIRGLLALWGFTIFIGSGFLSWRTISGPGDDNPAVILFVLGMLASLIPLAGIWNAITKLRPLFWIWTIVSVTILVTFSYFLSAFI